MGVHSSCSWILHKGPEVSWLDMDSANQESCSANRMSEQEHESLWKIQSQM